MVLSDFGPFNPIFKNNHQDNMLKAVSILLPRCQQQQDWQKRS